MAPTPGAPPLYAALQRLAKAPRQAGQATASLAHPPRGGDPQAHLREAAEVAEHLRQRLLQHRAATLTDQLEGAGAARREALRLIGRIDRVLGRAEGAATGTLERRAVRRRRAEIGAALVAAAGPEIRLHS